MSINRRKVLGGAGLAGAAAATGVGVDRLVAGGPSGHRADREAQISDDAARFGDPRLPDETINSQSHLFHLGDSPVSTFDGGSFQQADEKSFPILKGQEASIVLLTLQPGGIREPHWHPSAWEINIVTKGVAAWALVDGNGNHESFDQHVGDVVFAPQGSFHYFENRGPDDMKIMIIQNTSAPEAKDNIGIGESLSKLPPECCRPSSAFRQRPSSPSRRSTSAIIVLRRSR